MQVKTLNISKNFKVNHGCLEPDKHTAGIGTFCSNVKKRQKNQKQKCYAVTYEYDFFLVLFFRTE